jgi:hypothetical protein
MTGAPTPAGSAVQAAPRLFAALVDDAGLFPPEKLPMDAAVARHRSDEAADHPVLTQRFLCPVSALDDFRGRLGPDERWRIGLIVDVGLDALAAEVRDLAPDLTDRARWHFQAYGSCSTSEPVADLADLRLVGKDG